ncbi:hypothetical protein MASR2M78_05720 [Treponema sp.]
MKKNFKSLRYLLILIMLAAAFLYWRNESQQSKTKAAALIPSVRTEKPLYRDLVETFSLKSHVEAEDTVTVLPLVSGTIQSVEVEIGEAVAKDQVLALIDPERYKLQLSQAEAMYLGAKNSFERMEQLYKANAGTQQNYDQAKAQFDASRSQWELAKLQLGYTSMKSPVEGLVLALNLSTGDFAAPERPLATIGDLSRLVVRTRVPESRYARFLQGNVKAEVEQDGEKYQASIKSLAPFVSAQTRTFEVVYKIEGNIQNLRPGMSVTVIFSLESQNNVLSLPYMALGFGRELWYVEDGRAHSQKTPELFSDGKYFEIPKEFEGRTYIVEGQHFLTEGQEVKELEVLQ